MKTNMILTLCVAAVTLNGMMNPADAAPRPTTVPAELKESGVNYAAVAGEVSADLQTRFYLPKSGLYVRSLKDRDIDFMWGNGVTFSSLVAAARHLPATYLPLMNTFFAATNRYWDAKAPVPGYEPAPTAGNGHDKYYDDNAWMVLTFIEAYELTHEPKYLQRAEAALKFVLSGWDDQLGGGIWWHEGHKEGGKNTCVNAPAAVGCLTIAKYLPKDQAARSIDMAKKLVAWTTQTLQADDGLFFDNINVTSKKVERTKWTYNAALMIRANLGLYRQTGQADYLHEAQRIAKAADALVDPNKHAYHDGFKFTHLLVEADLELYRTTGEAYLLQRSIANADYAINLWRTKKPTETIETAAIARMLWLMADMQTEAGLRFWQRLEQTKTPAH